jgi:EF hand
MIDEMDRDGSGFISLHEMKVFLTKKFVELNNEPAETV